AAAEAVALDAGDHGSRARIDRLAHPIEAERVLDVLFVREVDRGALPLDVGACTKTLTLPREHDRSRIADAVEGFRQLCDQSGVESVSPLRLRERDPKDRPVSLDTQRAHRGQLKVALCFE